MKQVRIAYIGGGSKAWAQLLMKDLLLQDKLWGEVKLYDTHREAAEKNKVVLEKLAAHKDAKSSWSVGVYDSLATVLPGSDFVVLSILPGTFEDMMVDVHHPETYHIWQSVGDTVGPGGYARALRLFRDYVPIARAIEAYAPRAWVINYTNPMSLSLKLLYSVYPDIKAVGCCHEVFGTQKLLAKAYTKFSDTTEEIHRHDIHVNVQGINHFTWINEATYKGEDILPFYDRYVDKYIETGSASKGQSVTEKQVAYFASMDKVKMDLYRRFGVVAAAGDRHLAEFMAEDYLKTPELARETWAFELTPVQWRMDNDRQLLARREQMIAGEVAAELTASEEEGANILIALSGIKPCITNANYPNIGQAPDLPRGAIVETNIAFSKDKAEPMNAGPMKAEVRALVMGHISTQEAFTKAWLEGDREGLVRAFLMEPSVARLSEQEGRQLFEELTKHDRQET